MFDSGVNAKGLIDTISLENDISVEISDDFYYLIYSRLISLLYSEFIKEQKEYEVENPDSTVELNFAEKGYENIRFCDIYKVYAQNSEGNIVELERCDLSRAISFMSNCYYYNNGKLFFKADFPVNKLNIVYCAIPENLYKLYASRKSYDSVNVPLPIEFVPMVTSYLRSEKYRLTNADDLCEKWALHYNSVLEDFKKWIDLKKDSDTLGTGE